MKDWFITDTEELYQLYYMYEFTDDIVFLPEESTNYPNIFNFVKTGILMEEEAYQALFYQNT